MLFRLVVSLPVYRTRGVCVCPVRMFTLSRVPPHFAMCCITIFSTQADFFHSVHFLRLVPYFWGLVCCSNDLGERRRRSGEGGWRNVPPVQTGHRQCTRTRSIMSWAREKETNQQNTELTQPKLNDYHYLC